MAEAPLIQVDSVSKKFCRDLRKSLWYGMRDLSRTLSFRQAPSDPSLRDQEFWAVKDVSFELSRGECLGLLGRNGAGKTTLLKMISGLVPPDAGEITLRGRLGALIALGAGFHPLLTGRENIYINGSVLGVSRKIIDQKLDEIIDFSGIEDFIDAPVQSYSSGMTVRLGFAVAAKLVTPDILLLDEILAVGDQAFRAKCYATVSEALNRSAVIFVSHSMQAINRITNKTLLLDQGRQIYLGPTPEGIRQYFEVCGPGATQPMRSLGNGEVQLYDISLLDERSVPIQEYQTGSPCFLRLELFAAKVTPAVDISITILNAQQELVAQCHSSSNNVVVDRLEGHVTIGISLQSLPLNPGNYTVNLVISERFSLRHLCWDIGIIEFKVAGGFIGTASVQLQGTWHLQQSNEIAYANAARQRKEDADDAPHRS